MVDGVQITLGVVRTNRGLLAVAERAGDVRGTSLLKMTVVVQQQVPQTRKGTSTRIKRCGLIVANVPTLPLW